MRPPEWALTAARAACGIGLARRGTVLDVLQGGRMAAQAGAEACCRAAPRPAGSRIPAGSEAVYTASAAVDALHAATMLALAARRAGRRHAVGSAAVALGFLAGDLMIRRGTRPPTPSARTRSITEA